MAQKSVGLAMFSSLLVGAGCATTHSHSSCPHGKDAVKVTVRFVAPPDQASFASAASSESGARLVSEKPAGGFEAGGSSSGASDPGLQHVVLWGGPFGGENVTHNPTPLTPGSYMFGMFAPDQGAAYQGWISVDNGGDDVLSVLTEWRDTVREQKEWLGFENRMEGKFASRNAADFKQYEKDLSNLNCLEHRINMAIRAELWDQSIKKEQQGQFMHDAEVLLMPGQGGFLQPFTRPAFTAGELESVRSGEAMTKVLLVADYDKTMERLGRVVDLREDLSRTRCVFAEEVRRLDNRRRYYRLTDHLYHHDKKFVENEKRLQEARGMIDKIDQQIAEHRRQCHALMYVAGLFSPGQNFDLFEDEARALQHDRVVLAEEKRQIDLRFDQSAATGNHRVALERDRQNVLAAIESIDAQIAQIGEARIALGKLRDNSEVIHRKGPACILATSLVDNSVPMPLASAIERESMMTVRLQAADSMDMPSASSVTERTSTRVITTSSRD